MGRLYLAYCEGGFAERRIGVVQTVLAKPHWRGSVRAGVTAPPPAISPIAAAG
jgi:cyclopropane-fatty-acyl-phospholipid synthase